MSKHYDYWPELQEIRRLQQVYAGLKTGAATRPRYIFNGKRRNYYERYHPDKKIKTIFVPGLGLRSYRPIVGASPGTYYMRADGTAANKSAATSPSNASTAMSIATVNGETFDAGDLLPVSDQGGIYRDELLSPSSGADGIPIIFRNVNGESPIISAADLVTTWADEGGNVWSASFTPAGTRANITKLFLDGRLGIDAGSQAAVDAENEWHYDTVTDTLYVYSTSDPDTAFTNPGIEAPSRNRAIFFGAPGNPIYITVDGIDCVKGNNECVKATDSSRGIVLTNLTIQDSDSGSGFLQTGNASDTQLINLLVRDNGIATSTQEHGVYMNTPTEVNGPFLIDSCEFYGNGAYGIHCFASGGGTIRFSSAHDQRMRGGLLISDLGDDVNIDVEYFLGYDNPTEGIRVRRLGNTYNGNNDVNLYNGVTAGNDQFGGISIIDNASANSTITVRNYICSENVASSNEQGELYVNNNLAAVDLNYDLYWRSDDLRMISFNGITYSQVQFATYQSATGQDAMSISADPLFVDVINFDFRLRVKSPCINAGVDVGLRRDFAGTSVPRGRAPDIGAYEFERHGSLIIGASATPLISLSKTTEIDEFWEGYFRDIERAQNA